MRTNFVGKADGAKAGGNTRSLRCGGAFNQTSLSSASPRNPLLPPFHLLSSHQTPKVWCELMLSRQLQI